MMEVKELLSVEKGLIHGQIPCVSIIIPTHRTSPERQIDRVSVERGIKQAVQTLKKKYPDFHVVLSETLRKVADEIDFLHNDFGIGIFVSPYFSRWIKFSFEVNEKIHIGNSFRLRELIYHQKINPTYFYLSITTNKIKFFEGIGPALIEIKNDFFPHLIIDDYIYERPSLGSSYGNSLKSTEKDKSILREKRLMSELKKVDTIINTFLNGRPLFISGVKKETGYYVKISKHKKNLAGIIEGNYTKGNQNVPSEKVYDEVLAWQNMKENETLDELSDYFGKRQVASGLEEAWYAAKNGMGLVLFVEEGFECTAYLNNSAGLLSREVPKDRFTEIPDAVDYLMALVLSMNGKIQLVGNNKLAEHDRIALRLRYRKSDW